MRSLWHVPGSPLEMDCRNSRASMCKTTTWGVLFLGTLLNCPVWTTCFCTTIISRALSRRHLKGCRNSGDLYSPTTCSRALSQKACVEAHDYKCCFSTTTDFPERFRMM